MQFKISRSYMLVLLAVITLTNCRKKEDFDSDSSVSYTTTDNLFKDMYKIVTEVADEEMLNGKTEGSHVVSALCANVSVTPADLTTFPKTVVIDFGDGCADQQGIMRKGKVTAIYSGFLHTPGSRVKVSLSGYSVNDVEVSGQYSLANTSPDTSTRTFSDTITNGTATTPDAKVCKWNATRYITQSAGFGTGLISDDAYTGSGNSHGTGFNGKGFDATSSNVVMRLTCRYLVSGTCTVHSANNATPAIIDFGTGACDNKYQVSYDTYTTTLEFGY